MRSTLEMTARTVLPSVVRVLRDLICIGFGTSVDTVSGARFDSKGVASFAANEARRCNKSYA